MQISLVTRYMSDCSMIFYFWRVLTATFSSVNRWVANLTLPKVPSPMHFPTDESGHTYLVVAQRVISLSRNIHFQNIDYS